MGRKTIVMLLKWKAVFTDAKIVTTLENTYIPQGNIRSNDGERRHEKVINATVTNRLRIGVIADDFTGAGDAASYLSLGGMRTLLVIYPYMEEADPEGWDAVVIGLKSRSEAAGEAVSDCLEAVRWLREKGAEKIYFKYCSTFDSTPSGNIGPVSDAVMEQTASSYSILCPSLPDNGRCVRKDILFVKGIPLAESPMKDHPLNPMWDSRVSVLMQAQSRYPVFPVSREEMRDPERLKERVEGLVRAHTHFYLVPDYESEEDGVLIAQFFGSLPFLTGGSGLLQHLGRSLRQTAERDPAGEDTIRAGKKKSEKDPGNGRVMFCGSCSEMTQKQVRRFIEKGGKAVRIDTVDLAEEGLDKRVCELAELSMRHPEEDILYYSSGSAGLRDKENPDPMISGAMERFIAKLAATIVAGRPAERIIVAGGETSGAVTLALGLHTFGIGESIAPGVPILHPVGKDLRLVLKSGNFGNEDFFVGTLEDEKETAQ